jgi:hypothetical protein
MESDLAMRRDFDMRLEVLRAETDKQVAAAFQQGALP